jgi:phosphate-selective porin OprO/OprP
VDRTDGGAANPTPGLSFNGGYVEASWVLTGEPRSYSASGAAFGSPHPKSPFSLKEGGIGAFELVGRYSTINLNDNVTRGRSAATTGGVYGGKQDVYAIGVNWYPNDQLRFMLDYDIIAVDKLNPAGTTQIGQRIQAVGFRAQAAF